MCPLSLRRRNNPHLFLHCNLAYGLWGQILQLCGVQWVMPATVKELLSLYLVLHWPKAGRIIWKATVATIIWTIWNERNSRIFQGIATEGPALLHKVTSLITSWASNHRIFAGLPASSFLYNWGNIMLHRPRKAQRTNSWQPPTRGTIKLNFDGCSLENQVKSERAECSGTTLGQFYSRTPNTWAFKTLSMLRHWPFSWV
ncbi:hypothetical protein AMTRI_Chr06g196500 [Amborella trichopoda]